MTDEWPEHETATEARLSLKRAWERGYRGALCLHTESHNKQLTGPERRRVQNIKLKFMRCIGGHNGWPKHPWE